MKIENNHTPLIHNDLSSSKNESKKMIIPEMCEQGDEFATCSLFEKCKRRALCKRLIFKSGDFQVNVTVEILLKQLFGTVHV